jgi:hypothetical protein
MEESIIYCVAFTLKKFPNTEPIIIRCYKEKSIAESKAEVLRKVNLGDNIQVIPIELES